MNAGDGRELNDCGCCEGLDVETPVDIWNPAGLNALAYRVGTHSRFKRSMLVGLTRAPVLLELKTRRDDDPTIGLLDAWAVALDVLTFYQERIANEGYLRTSTERRSLLELARAIGYELRPGVAASTYFRFTLETAAGAPTEVTVSSGTKAQSIPGENEQAQIFETVEEIKARPAWNELRPRATEPQQFKIKDGKLRFEKPGDPAVNSIRFKGTSTGLTAGDWVLITLGAGAATTVPRQVAAVKIDDQSKCTEVQLEAETSAAASQPGLQIPSFIAFPTIGPLVARPLPFTADAIETAVLRRTISERELQTILETHRWSADALADFVATRNANRAVANQAVYAFRERAGFFGNNAPPYNSLRDSAQNPLLYPDWDSYGWSIWRPHPNSKASGSFLNLTFETKAWLERSISGIAKNSWMMISDASQRHVYRVAEAREASQTGFGMSGKTTVVKLHNPDGSDGDRPGFLVRDSTAHLKSEALALAEIPLPEIIDANISTLHLDGMVLGLKPGQLVVLHGEQQDAPGVFRDELLSLEEINHHDGHTTILFHEQSGGGGLRYSYRRNTVILNANVARATHGETKSEVLGGGDAATAFQKFVLKQAPLTYVSAPTTSGIASTLQLRVNDVLWDESRSLYRAQPNDRIYVTRQTDDSKTVVQFGDGLTGARLPTGVENIAATYRAGVGLGGMVKAGQISLLLTRSLGLKEVVNPWPANGGADPETRDGARGNAPVTVLTLDRIVSLQDFEDFARAYPGIGKAQATWLWQGEDKIVRLTIAGGDGAPVSPLSDLYKNLQLSMNGARDPGPRVLVGSYLALSFNLQAKLLITRGYLADKVKEAVSAALLAAFSFSRRAFGQAVTNSEIYGVAQSVDGVEAVDLDYFYLSGRAATLEERLAARVAGWDHSNAAIQPAELLLINPRGVQLTEMAL
ncbi:MAG TPA: putative baseplate assembly protein [Chthoniobacterales bacterium]|nr:putative baseplate assembly protein [Chthoniobacterales bacterium]